jgi:LEA14-like dessication related protein
MTSARRLALAALLLAPLALAGCAAVGELAKAAFQRPTLTFQKASVESIDFEAATLALDYDLENPNGFGLTLARVEYWLQLDGRVVTRGQVRGGLSIPAAGHAPVRFTVRLPFAEVPRLVEVVRAQKPVAYTVGGNVGVETPIGVLDLPITHSDQVALPALPRFRLAGVAVRLVSLTDVELRLSLAIDNPNPFPIPAGALKYAAAVGGEVVASADAEALGAIGARREGTVTIPIRLSILGAGRALSQAVNGGSADVRLQGEARLGAIPVPLDVSGRAGGR